MYEFMELMPVYVASFPDESKAVTVSKLADTSNPLTTAAWQVALPLDKRHYYPIFY